MGDRANIYVHTGNYPGVYLYTHWSGTELPVVLANALERGEDRWSDEQYLARIIFCEMVRGHELATTGFGISAIVGDGDNRIIDVDVGNQSVTIKGAVFSFPDFIATADKLSP